MSKEYTVAELNAALNQFGFEGGTYTEGDIKKKYREKALKFHSDKNGADEELKKAYEEAFKKVCRYKEILEWTLEGIKPKMPEEPNIPSTQPPRDYSPYPDSDDDFSYGHTKAYMDAYEDYIKWKTKVEQNEARAREERAREERAREYARYYPRREERSSVHSSHLRDGDRQRNHRPQYVPKQYTPRHDSDEEHREFQRTAARAREKADKERNNTQGQSYPRPRPDARVPPSSTAHRRASEHDDRFFRHVPAPKTTRSAPTRDDRGREREHRQGTSSTKTTTRTVHRIFVNGQPVDRIIYGGPDGYVDDDHYCDSPDEYADDRYNERVNSSSKYTRPPKSNYRPKGPRYHL